MELKFPLLTADDIEVKVKQITAKGAIALLYKNARTDMNVLDSVVGVMNWHDTYREVKDNLYCAISIYDADKKEWVSKEDCGIESRKDDEGNQKKGEASDAFKRAGFKWGIGRELYTSPFIFLNCPTQAKTGSKSFELVDRYARFSVKSIGYDKANSINALIIVDKKGNQVYKIGQEPPQEAPPQAQPSKADPSTTKPKSHDTAHQIAFALIKRFGEKQASEMLFPITGYKSTKEIPDKELKRVLDLISGFEEIV